MTLITIVPSAQPQALPQAQPKPRAVGPDRLAGRHGARIRRLAQELNVSPETFFDGPPDGDAGELFALMRHWLAIGDGQARRRVLSLARQEAERAGYSECA